MQLEQKKRKITHHVKTFTAGDLKTLPNSTLEEVEVTFGGLFFNRFFKILACRYSTLASAVMGKNCSHTSSLSWATLATIRIMMTRMVKMTARGITDAWSSSLGVGRHSRSKRVTE